MLTLPIREGVVVSYCPIFLEQIDEKDSQDMQGVVKNPNRRGRIEVRWFGGGYSLVQASRLVEVRYDIRDPGRELP
jgi:hypothetical protein